MSAELLFAVAGALISLLCSYVPGLSEWYAALDGTRKRLGMLAALCAVAAAILGLSCLGDAHESIDNDDIGRLRAAPRALAQAAYLTLSKAISNIFTSNSGADPTMSDSQALFHANYANLGTTALSVSSFIDARHSQLRNQAAADGGQNMALYVQHGALRLEHCLVENISPAGYCLLIDGAVASLNAGHTTFRKADATYAIKVSGATTRPMTLARCCGNGPLSPLLSGYHDYVYDSTI
jgi:hypothetical protein